MHSKKKLEKLLETCKIKIATLGSNPTHTHFFFGFFLNYFPIPITFDLYGASFVSFRSGPELPCNRAANVFFNFRQPAPIIQTNVVNLLAYPIGKLLAYALPIKTWRLPRLLGGGEFSLNPGPWNIKEHALVNMMSNVASMSPYAINAVAVAEMDYGQNVSYWFSVVLVMATQLTGFGMAGLCRRVLVWPASMVWPQNLVTCTVLNTLHAEEDEGRGGITRYKYFMYVVIGSFFFFFLPGASFSLLSPLPLKERG